MSSKATIKTLEANIKVIERLYLNELYKNQVLYKEIEGIKNSKSKRSK